MANLLLYGFIVAILLGWGILRLSETLVRRLWRMKRVPILWQDEDAGAISLRWEKRVGNELPNQTLMGKPARPILSGPARQTLRLGKFGTFSTWVLSARDGANLIPMSNERRQFFGLKDEKIRELDISNALSYWHAIANDEARSATEAGKEEEPAWVKMMPYLMVLAVVTVAMIGFVIYQVGKLLASKGAQGATGQMATTGGAQVAHAAAMVAPHVVPLVARAFGGA